MVSLGQIYEWDAPLETKRNLAPYSDIRIQD